MRTINYFSNERQVRTALAANAIRACRSIKRLRKCYKISEKQVEMMKEAYGLVSIEPSRYEKKTWYEKGA